MPNPNPEFYIKTFGCKLNQYFSEVLKESLEDAGFIFSKESPDIVIVNSCTVTHKADRDARKCIHKWKKLGKKVILTGCYAKREKNINDVLILPEIEDVLKYFGIERKRIISDFSEKVKAFVMVHTGCDNFCSYCIVPYVRGAPRSRPYREIIEEAENLVKRGFKEIILTGINIGKYNFNDKRLIDVMRGVSKISGIKRIWLSSIEPDTLADDIIDFVAEEKKFAKYFHIPLQSGSDKILKLMGRRYDKKFFEKLILKIKGKIHDCGIGTDVICGFPGEEDEDFEETFRFLKDLPFSNIHAFSFSARPGTKAEKLEGKVESKKIKERMQRLQKLKEEKLKEFVESFKGKKINVHFENYKEGFLCGTSYNYIKVKVKGEKCFVDGFFDVEIKNYKNGYAEGLL